MKRLLISGAAKSIGAAIAVEFAKHNYDIILNYHTSLKEAEELKTKLENQYHINVYLYCADVSDEQQVKMMYNYIFKQIGQVTCLVNNAAIAMDNDLESKDAKEFMKVVQTNLLGTYLMCKHVRKVMNEGSIINISSTNAIDTNYIESIDYDASKAGVISLMQNFANFYAPFIRVNTIAPGWVNTSSLEKMQKDFKEQEKNKILLRRFAEVQEIADVVYFLASSKASYINKTVIRVDGGIK